MSMRAIPALLRTCQQFKLWPWVTITPKQLFIRAKMLTHMCKLTHTLYGKPMCNQYYPSRKLYTHFAWIIALLSTITWSFKNSSPTIQSRRGCCLQLSHQRKRPLDVRFAQGEEKTSEFSVCSSVITLTNAVHKKSFLLFEKPGKRMTGHLCACA